MNRGVTQSMLQARTRCLTPKYKSRTHVGVTRTPRAGTTRISTPPHSSRTLQWHPSGRRTSSRAHVALRTRRAALGAPLWLALTPLAVVLVPRVLGSLAALALLAPLASDARRAPARRAHVLPPPQALTRVYVQLPQVQVLLKRVGGPLVELALPPRLGFGLLLQLVLEDLNLPRPLQTPRVLRRGLAFFCWRCIKIIPLLAFQRLPDLLLLDRLDELLAR